MLEHVCRMEGGNDDDDDGDDDDDDDGTKDVLHRVADDASSSATSFLHTRAPSMIARPCRPASKITENHSHALFALVLPPVAPQNGVSFIQFASCTSRVKTRKSRATRHKTHVTRKMLPLAVTITLSAPCSVPPTGAPRDVSCAFDVTTDHTSCDV